MTEAEWRDCSDPSAMLRSLEGRVSDGKLRLFLCACARRVRGLLGKACWKAVRVAEAWADGLVDDGALERARHAAERESAAVFESARRQRWSAPALASRAALATVMSGPDWAIALEAAAAVAIDGLRDRLLDRVLWYSGVGADGIHFRYRPAARGEDRMDERAAALRLAEMIQEAWWSERRVQVDMLRCVVAPPQAVNFPSQFRTEDVLGLARGIDADGAYDRLSLLADALMDAGCDDETLLAHARADGHARGCWLVDLVLGRE